MWGMTVTTHIIIAMQVSRHPRPSPWVTWEIKTNQDNYCVLHLLCFKTYENDYIRLYQIMSSSIMIRTISSDVPGVVVISWVVRTHWELVVSSHAIQFFFSRYTGWLGQGQGGNWWSESSLDYRIRRL
jgi:hypothetical protein